MMRLAQFYACWFGFIGIGLVDLEEIGHQITWRSLPHARLDLEYFEYSNLSCTHAESPVWDADSGALYWVDVLHQDVYALDLQRHSLRTKHIEYGEVNVVVPVANSKRLLVGVRQEVYLLDWQRPGDSALRLVAALDVGRPDNILNEGKADALGRFWGGTKGRQKGDEVAPDEATLYSLQEPTFTAKVQLKPVTISNGMTWSLNDSVFYYIDSPTKRIDAFDYDLLDGQISNRRTIVDISQYSFNKEAIPDGMTIDREGLLWVAMMFDGSIIRIDPDRRSIVARYPMPVSRITSLVWGGAHLNDLFVTTSRRNISPEHIATEPLAGGTIFVLHHLGTGGVPDNKVVFPLADLY